MTGRRRPSDSSGGESRTVQTVRRQLAVLGLGRCEIGLLDAGSGRMETRAWTPEQVLASLSWLRQRNTQGYDVFVRSLPGRNHDLVLLDDLDAATVERMQSDGVTPAVVTETSPGNLQAWVRFGEPLATEERTAISRALAKRYGGDPGAIGPDRYGRLAGFTNRKPEHRQARGLHPFVLLRYARAANAERASEIRKEVAQKTVQSGPLRTAWRTDASAAPAYAQAKQELEGRYGGDRSRLDWHVVRRLAWEGHAPAAIAAALRADPETARKRDPDDYVRRTVTKATGVVSPDRGSLLF